jgi:hypothetical protein
MSEGALKAIRKINATCGVDEDDGIALEDMLRRNSTVVTRLIWAVTIIVSAGLAAIGKEIFGG